MHPLQSRILDSIKDNTLITPPDSVIVAVSGGPDSVALLSLLTGVAPDCTFRAVYINHNLRPDETGRERELVCKLCETYQVPFETISVDVTGRAEKKGHSVEACARHLRYRALEQVRRDCQADLIAVGHTSDDQAEQFLIRLIRGSGLKGLGGMSAKRGRIIRPLLGIRKEELLSYLDENGIDYCLDSSNNSRSFLRNKVRLDLLPLLEKDFNPSIKQTILNTMSVLQDEEALLETLAKQSYQAAVSIRTWDEGSSPREEQTLSTPTFLALHPAIRRRIIEMLCWENDCRPTFKMIDRIIHLARAGRSGTHLHLPDDLKVIKTSDSIVFSRQVAAGHLYNHGENRFGPDITITGPGDIHVVSLGIVISIKEREATRMNCESCLIVAADLIDYPLVLRAPRPGEVIRPLGAPGRKKITRILSDRKIPRHLRYRFPLLVSGDAIVAITGVVINDDFKTGPATTRFLLISTHEESAV